MRVPSSARDSPGTSVVGHFTGKITKDTEFLSRTHTEGSADHHMRTTGLRVKHNRTGLFNGSGIKLT